MKFATDLPLTSVHHVCRSKSSVWVIYRDIIHQLLKSVNRIKLNIFTRSLPFKLLLIKLLNPPSSCVWVNGFRVVDVVLVLFCIVYSQLWSLVDHRSSIISLFSKQPPSESFMPCLPSRNEIGPCIGPQWSVIGSWCCDWHVSIAACGTILNSTVTAHLYHVFASEILSVSADDFFLYTVGKSFSSLWFLDWKAM
jgi:hypothetical protein